MKNLKHYLAHMRWNEDGSFAIHTLEDHLRAVGDLVKAIQGCIDRHPAA
ncbi:MAG: hypothetical protein L0H94_03475 [Nitrospira sp.]|nr:hypothetical protein [Nitrospira sp.]